jgi:hypothetical protein
MPYITRATNAAVLFALVIGLGGCSFFLKKDDPNKVSAREVKVHYRSPSHEELNTFQTFFRKETRPGHYAEMTFDLDASQQLLILNRAFLTKFFNLPPVIAVTTAAKDTSFLRVASGTLDWTVRWRGSRAELDAAGTSLPEFLDYLDSTIHATRAYKQLPKSDAQ